MGVSVSAAVAIVFTGFLVSASVFFAVFDATTSKIMDSQDRNNDDAIDRLHTDIAIINSTYNSTTLTLAIAVKNTGSTVVQADKVQLLIDGKMMTKTIDWNYTHVDGTLSHLWGPDQMLTIIVTALFYVYGHGPSAVEVVTSNGISDTSTDIYIPP